MWIIDLPRVGTADEPTPCLGDARFTEAKTSVVIRQCQAVCATCRWRPECQRLADALTSSGEQISGVWAGVHYGIDHERRPGDPHHRGGRAGRTLAAFPPVLVRLQGAECASPSPGDVVAAIPRQRSAEPW